MGARGARPPATCPPTKTRPAHNHTLTLENSVRARNVSMAFWRWACSSASRGISEAATADGMTGDGVVFCDPGCAIGTKRPERVDGGDERVWELRARGPRGRAPLPGVLLRVPRPRPPRTSPSQRRMRVRILTGAMRPFAIAGHVVHSIDACAHQRFARWRPDLRPLARQRVIQIDVRFLFPNAHHVTTVATGTISPHSTRVGGSPGVHALLQRCNYGFALTLVRVSDISACSAAIFSAQHCICFDNPYLRASGFHTASLVHHRPTRRTDRQPNSCDASAIYDQVRRLKQALAAPFHVTPSFSGPEFRRIGDKPRGLGIHCRTPVRVRIDAYSEFTSYERVRVAGISRRSSRAPPLLCSLGPQCDDPRLDVDFAEPSGVLGEWRGCGCALGYTARPLSYAHPVRTRPSHARFQIGTTLE